jgi:hypothetical protein
MNAAVEETTGNSSVNPQNKLFIRALLSLHQQPVYQQLSHQFVANQLDLTLSMKSSHADYSSYYTEYSD